jgi:hypothetical protein
MEHLHLNNFTEILNDLGKGVVVRAWV